MANPPISSLLFYGAIISLVPAIIFRNTFQDTLTDLFAPSFSAKNNTSADVLILGGGHAGLSAALTLARHQHTTIILNSDVPRNKWKTTTHVVSTWEDKSPDDLKKASLRELRRSGFAAYVKTEILHVEKDSDDFFVLTNKNGESWKGRKLVLAIGAEHVFPDIPGYEENFPDRILHCLFTRGLEFKGSTSAGLIAQGLSGTPYHAAMLVEDGQKFAEKVSVYTNGNAALAQEIRKVLLGRGESEVEIDSRAITRLSKNGTDSMTLTFEDGESRTESFLIHQPSTRVNPNFVSRLGLEINERGDIVTKMPFYATNVQGVYAAGDCASPFKIIPNAMFMGANAGAGVARELPRRVTGNSVDRLGANNSWLRRKIW